MNLLAALIFFTRLPLWKWKTVSSECFKHVVPYWPMVGWVTGGTVALLLWGCSHIMPLSLAWLVALAGRLLLTGCLHEDGLADFFDGFGGGTTRQRTLAIMKDSHIGTYGVIGLIVYFLLISQWANLPLELLCALAFCADCWSKCCASQLINLLPYARNEEESKAKVIYNRMNGGELFLNLSAGVVPMLLLLPPFYWLSSLGSLLVLLLLVRLMKRRLQGYTGDCCGATFLLCELAFYLTAFLLYFNRFSGVLL